MEVNEKASEKEYSEFVKKYFWLIRPCGEYETEAKDCKSVHGRFHQYFVHGELLDCTSWNQDAEKCDLCVFSKNDEACKIIILNERTRRVARLEGHKKNDVWKKRTEKPPNWNFPLEKWWLVKHENSLLMKEAKAYDEHIAKYQPVRHYSCTIL